MKDQNEHRNIIKPKRNNHTNESLMNVIKSNLEEIPIGRTSKESHTLEHSETILSRASICTIN